MTAIRFESIMINENGDPLVDLSDYPFVLEPIYFNQGHSTEHGMYLRKTLADKLARIQKDFKGRYQFKIWDGHRPRIVQDAIYQSFYAQLKSKHPEWDDAKLVDETQRFVTMASQPGRIPPHSTGGSVDLTLVDDTGKELDMGTGFDHFGPEAGAMYYEDNDIDQVVKANRRLLRDSLEVAGLSPDADEWWHFDYGNQLWAFRTKHHKAVFGEYCFED